MVVRLFFSDKSSVVRSFSDKELFEYEILNNDNLLEYFEQHLDLPYSVEDWEFTDNSSKSYSNVYMVDLREIINYCESLINKNIDGRVVERYEFLSEDSYEFNVASLEKNRPDEIYYRNVLFDFDYSKQDSYFDYWQDGSEYNDE